MGIAVHLWGRAQGTTRFIWTKSRHIQGALLWRARWAHRGWLPLAG